MSRSVGGSPARRSAGPPWPTYGAENLRRHWPSTSPTWGRRYGFALGVVCALGTVLPGCSSRPGSTGAPAELAREPLRLVTWNIRKGEGGLDRVVAELRRHDADVVCLQEVVEPRPGGDAPDQTQTIAAALGLHHYSHGGRLDDKRNQCLAILCRAPLTDATALATGPDRNYSVSAVTRWRGQPLRIVCVHLAGTYKLDWGHIQDTSAARERDWQSLLEMAGGWSTGTLVAGDFNTLPAAPQFEELSKRLSRAGDPTPTFPSSSPALPLDHVFLSPDLSSLSVVVGETDVSDHRPVVVELQRRSPPH
jgi:endonuclease/exonuclease/phosphatase family metal-dependent hydrolase